MMEKWLQHSGFRHRHCFCKGQDADFPCRTPC